MKSSRYLSSPLHPRVRQLIEAVQPTDPILSNLDLPPVDIVVPCAAKDIALLPLTLEGATACSRNPVASKFVVVPAHLAAHFRHIGNEVQVVVEDDVLPSELCQVIESCVPMWRRGWVKQQLVKYLLAHQSSREGTLVVDADTILLRSRAWLGNNGEQVLCLSHEYHIPYVYHAARMWGSEPVTQPLSYVTHHQLLQRSVLSGMFPNGLNDYGLWIETADWRQTSPLSEYHCYGSWLTRNYPDRALWAQWANTSISDDAQVKEVAATSLESLRTLFEDSFSVSFHTHR